ncbi:MAG: hypothetical protein ACLGIG_03580 [Actinomycetes bacterium]
MIFVSRGGGGGCLVLLLFVALIGFSGSGRGPSPLLFLALFVLVPFLFMRSAARSAGGGHRVHWRTYGSRHHGRQPIPYPPPQRPAPQRSAPQQPVDPADVQSVVARLAHDVRTLEPGDDPVARQAMVDASERYTTATSLLERARSDDALRTAWLAAAEGLHATRLVRSRRGLDPGPAPHLPPASGPQLDRPATVTVQGRQHVGSPTYAPGHRHWFPGGRVGDVYVPGGWYREPFWPGDLVLGVLSGWMLGSLLSASMFDAGLDGGYDGGYDGGDGGADGGADGGWDGGGGGGWGDDGTHMGGGWDGGGGGWGDSGWGDGGGGWGDGGDIGGDFGGDW